MLKEHYWRSLKTGVLHFAAHSHHPRPNVTREATIQCWDDAARMLDAKWEHIFGEVVPLGQRNIAELLELDNPRNIAFGGNTHEFLTRIVSSFPPEKPLRILTTTNEFRSAERMFARLKERGSVRVRKVPVAPHGDFAQRFKQEAFLGDGYDIVFFSQVFFDSGFLIRQEDLAEMVEEISENAHTIVIDGYHGFCAVPTSLQKIQNKAFYMAGGYKYAQWGEGACFLCVPPNCTLRPENTGWFAEFGDLQKEKTDGGAIAYPNDAFRFFGATFDPAGLYRLNAVCEWMRGHNITVSCTHEHIAKLQLYFEKRVESINSDTFNQRVQVTPRAENMRGHFLSYELQNPEHASVVVRRLRNVDVVVDSRGKYVRVGFGMYHDAHDVDRLVERIQSLGSLTQWRDV